MQRWGKSLATASERRFTGKPNNTACERGSAPAASKAAAGGGFSSLTTREQEILANAMTCLKAAPSLVAFWSIFQANSRGSEGATSTQVCGQFFRSNT